MQTMASQKKKTEFSDLPHERLESMREAGDMILECQRVLGNTNQNIVSELLRFTDEFLEWNHLPEKDVHDTHSHAQYYFHAHPKTDDPEYIHNPEHGHFHTFLRAKGMKDDMAPLPVQDMDPKQSINDMLSHIVGIGMDEYGRPINLFTTNRWVTGETWYKAEDVIRMLDLFEIDHAWPSWPVNLWVSSMIRLFRPQIETLLFERDKTAENWIKKHPDQNAYEDRDLEVMSFCPIDIEQQIQLIEEAL